MINISINKKKFENLDFLIPKDELHPEFWIDNDLEKEISLKLTEISTDILKQIKINFYQLMKQNCLQKSLEC